MYILYTCIVVSYNWTALRALKSTSPGQSPPPACVKLILAFAQVFCEMVRLGKIDPHLTSAVWIGIFLI